MRCSMGKDDVIKSGRPLLAITVPLGLAGIW